ncbi:MAG TPA: MBL fold metallo-hydrolase [Bacteroidales bacterium]|nr:MBL fold metallo-hydrolase [Bacteroidales bacterium]
MKVKFLGTGTSQGVPVIGCKCDACLSDNPKDKRLRSSILLENNETTVVIDTGPDFRQQMLRENVSNLDAVLYTHEHRDHIAGMDDIRSFNFLQKRSMDLYGEKRVLQSLRISFPYVFAKNKYPGVPQVILHQIEERQFDIKTIHFTPVRMLHSSMPVFGYRINDFAYLVDANFISEKEKEKLKGIKTVVIGALRKEKHHSHFTLDEAISLFNQIGAERAYISHISHQMGKVEDYSKLMPEGMEAAYDGLCLEI